MAQVTETWELGGEQVTVALDVTLPTGGETILTGDIGGLVPAGTTARLRGDCRLVDNLHVRGTLVCDPTGVDLDGQNLFDIHTHDGTLNLVGQQKTAWCRWGETPVGWELGDRLAIAPTLAGVFSPSEGLWTGDWDTMIRPANSPNVNMVPNPYLAVARPEVLNLSQKVTLRNLKRIMIHEATGPNPQTLKWLKVLNSGVAGVLGMYPIHFHMIGDFARGSLIEGVVVEGGKNHAFVPHGSHGITFLDTAGYKIINDAYWWDPPAGNPANHSNDVLWHHALALSVDPAAANTVSGFELGSGSGNECVDSVAACVRGGNNSAGFSWSETSNQPPNVWLFPDNTGHNNLHSGLRVWQNNDDLHLITRFIGYLNEIGINHGAYRNRYHYAAAALTGNGVSVRAHALSRVAAPLSFEDIAADSPMQIFKHNNPSSFPVVYRRCTFPSVLMRETNDGGDNPGTSRFEDCGLVPADFDLAGIIATTVLEIYEGGSLTHRWASGVWS